MVLSLDNVFHLKYAECSINTSLWQGISISSHLMKVSNSPYKCNLAARISCSRAFSLLPLAPMILEQVSKSLLVIITGQGTGPRAWLYIPLTKMLLLVLG